MSLPTRSALRLVGDVGGTNVRLALAEAPDAGGRLLAPWKRPRREFDGVEAAVDAFLQEQGARRPADAVIAIAGPVDEGAVVSTNSRWGISEAGLVAAGFSRARLVNDFAALAMGAAALGPQDLAPLDKLEPGEEGTLAVVGAGTGFGVSALVRSFEGLSVIASEGGHASFAPADDTEVEIWRLLSERYGHVSVERVLSGPGLANLHWALARIAGADIEPRSPAEIVAAARAGDAHCEAAVARFCAIYGGVAGDVALMFGARSGVFIGGGIAPRLLDIMRAGAFRARFEGKGRFRDYLSGIPVRVILHPYAALIGAARMALDQGEVR